MLTRLSSAIMYTWHTASSVKSPVKVMTKICILQRVHMRNSANRWAALVEGTKGPPFRKVQTSIRQTHYSFSEESPQYIASLTAFGEHGETLLSYSLW